MAQATNHVTIVFNKLCEIIASRPEVRARVQAKNFFGNDPIPGFQKQPSAKPADFPQVYILPGLGGDKLFSDSPTFDRESSTFSTETGEWIEPVAQSFRILVIGEDQNFTPLSQLAEEIKMSIRKAGRRLGLGQWCDMLKLTWRYELTDRFPECAKEKRWTWDAKLDFEFTFEGAAELIKP